jgi:type I restriction enzyme, S subunit
MATIFSPRLRKNAQPANARPYEIPSNWSWRRFAEVTICRDGQRVPVSKDERQGRVGPYDYYGASGIIDKIDNYIFDESLLLIGEDGANLISRSTPIAFIASGKYWVNNHAHVLDGLNPDSLRYLAVFINAIDLKPYVTGTAQPKMNQAKMNSIPVALPPLPEQKRIVAKVDQLMALGDELETKLRQSEETARKVAEALVAELLQG